MDNLVSKRDQKHKLAKALILSNILSVFQLNWLNFSLLVTA